MIDACKVAFNTWQEKTEWVQTDKRFDVLLPWGKHRADVLKEYIDRLESQVLDMIVQLANAESKCMELAAENAGLKDINAWCKTDAFKNMYREFKTAESLGCQGVDCMHDAMLTAIMHAPETPATDAFLAEVRAQGVDAAIEHRHKKFEGTGHIGVPVMALEWLSHEIRKGAAQ